MSGLNKEEWKDIITKLPSHGIYEEFNNLHDAEYCKTHFKDILKLELTYPGIRELCENFAGIMKELMKNSTNENYITERCKFLNFWLYDKISNNFGKYMSSTFSEDIVGPFIDKWREINTTFLNNYCSVRYEPDICIAHLNYYKKFYDYIKNEEHIVQKHFTEINECNKYYSYVKHINDIYEKNKDKCCEQDDPICRMFFFDCDEKYIPQKLMDKLKCHTLQKTYRDSNGLEAERVSQQLQINHSSSQSRDISVLNPGASTSSTSKMFMSITFPLIGILFIYSLIHKFTPLGPWLHNKILGNKVKLTNGLRDEYHQDFLGNEPIATDVNSQNDLYNIAYYQA
ncbi:PIR Superfamily Protein [Plasmodium ovale wallikeri]|uniref:PIR Superfamily Protein n=2 Tax=Plasmodium ovale TaxID=36330 RepID=A0A1A9A7H4_PLAOA|nr:PIR Superfamily Protein [Plasmodium ovale wallikeri]SBT55541.1 PIR Superfamily Protein [Plasmodium ovale wallikeri]SBT74556.1 Plasmodium vivax Vir protein, putative [Plasmodium ovale]